MLVLCNGLIPFSLLLHIPTLEDVFDEEILTVKRERFYFLFFIDFVEITGENCKNLDWIGKIAGSPADFDLFLYWFYSISSQF